MISRRRFLAGIGIAAAWGAAPATGVALAGSPPFGLAGRRGPLDLATVTADTFRPHVGTRFRLRRPGEPSLDLELVGVEAAPPDGGPTESFSLLFTAPRTAGLAQAAHPLEHGALGPFEIFLVPVGARGIEAVVNHLVA